MPEALELRKRLLSVILRKTLRGCGIPAKWIAAETKTLTSSSGDACIELTLEVRCEEPRFCAYLFAFQAEFLRRLTEIEQGSFTWFAGITWRLSNEPGLATAMPSRTYWDEVDRDREVTARVQGRASWDAATLESHFKETAPAELRPDSPNHAPRFLVRETLDTQSRSFTSRRREAARNAPANR